MVTDQTRRSLLKAALFGATAPILPLGCAAANEHRKAALIGCALTSRNQFSVVVASEDGAPIHQLPLPSRGHGIAVHPSRSHAVAFARRPGDYLMIFDYQTGQIERVILAKNNRYYYGHGVYSNDGLLLYVTEGERRSSRGIIGIYDAEKNYQKVAELTGFGIGPHEIIIMPDNSLVVGVGGVHTHGRKAINLATMEPSLSYLSAAGELLEQVHLPDRHLSIRHLAHDGNNTVLCGQQYRGNSEEAPALLAMHTQGGELEPLIAEPEQWSRFNQYIASIAASEQWILATSPRGNCYGIWSKQSKKLVELASLPDASGVVFQNQRFNISSGAGQTISVTKPKDIHSFSHGVRWDNHWSSIG
ncbi:DUF1513 domain-containing protein [Vibrio sinensis]|uniref:DUF1513 domain-containing protein n=1 Tax=Vibrio sinensis TaxID=2302434 RepID=A0A3A6QMS8_9VIBR|nr:DUF1513 domain-containing protein [Vibrio sinensis]RJX68375.1 DUF1513 domain-containing protein [Vibrio sinensis]